MHWKFATKAIHIGQEPDPLTGAVVVPIYQTSTYAQEDIGKHKGYEYSRTQNPTRTAWERAVAALEDGEYGISFASGMAAIDAVLRLFPPDSHIIAAEDMYGGTYRFFEQILKPSGYSFDYVDFADLKSVENAIRHNTRLLYFETPTNPTMRIYDIQKLSTVAHTAGITVAVDNTFASPYFQNPLQLGADIVIHSSTKYLGGHSDLIGGVVIVKESSIAEKLYFIQNTTGAIPSPFDCWLFLRSVKTLAVRMEQHQKNAKAIAELCYAHPAVEKVYYPGLRYHSGYQIARKQMRGYGGMVSLDFGSKEKAEKFLRHLQIFILGESLGGVESLACYPVVMTHASVPRSIRERLGITDGLVRLSCGIEDTEDLLDDIRTALDVL